MHACGRLGGPLSARKAAIIIIIVGIIRREALRLSLFRLLSHFYTLSPASLSSFFVSLYFFSTHDSNVVQLVSVITLVVGGRLRGFHGNVNNVAATFAAFGFVSTFSG